MENEIYIESSEMLIGSKRAEYLYWFYFGVRTGVLRKVSRWVFSVFSFFVRIGIGRL